MCVREQGADGNIWTQEGEVSGRWKHCVLERHDLYGDHVSSVILAGHVARMVRWELHAIIVLQRL
jgi:hypothetical protein